MYMDLNSKDTESNVNVTTEFNFELINMLENLMKDDAEENTTPTDSTYSNNDRNSTTIKTPSSDNLSEISEKKIDYAGNTEGNFRRHYTSDNSDYSAYPQRNTDISSNDKNLKKHRKNSLKIKNTIISINESMYSNLKGKFSSMIQNYDTSLVLQKCIHNSSQNVISNIFNEIETEIPNLISHVYANYFIQKLYFLLSPENRIVFMNIIKNNLLIISSNEIGNYPLQNIIENIKYDSEKIPLIEAINNNDTLIKMINNSFSVRVLEKIVSNVDEGMILNLYNLVVINFLNLSLNQYGIGLARKVIMNGRNLTTQLKIQKILIENFEYLIKDIYGNFTIQIALESWYSFLSLPLLRLFANKFANLSINKLSSNVVEKSFDVGGEKIVKIFIDEIISKGKLCILLSNKYGNFVLQKALIRASINDKILLINCILQSLAYIEDKKLIIKWKHFCEIFIESL